MMNLANIKGYNNTLQGAKNILNVLPLPNCPLEIKRDGDYIYALLSPFVEVIKSPEEMSKERPGDVEFTVARYRALAESVARPIACEYIPPDSDILKSEVISPMICAIPNMPLGDGLGTPLDDGLGMHSQGFPFHDGAIDWDHKVTRPVPDAPGGTCLIGTGDSHNVLDLRPKKVKWEYSNGVSVDGSPTGLSCKMHCGLIQSQNVCEGFARAPSLVCGASDKLIHLGHRKCIAPGYYVATSSVIERWGGLHVRLLTVRRNTDKGPTVYREIIPDRTMTDPTEDPHILAANNLYDVQYPVGYEFPNYPAVHSPGDWSLAMGAPFSRGKHFTAYDGFEFHLGSHPLAPTRDRVITRDCNKSWVAIIDGDKSVWEDMIKSDRLFLRRGIFNTTKDIPSCPPFILLEESNGALSSVPFEEQNNYRKNVRSIIRSVEVKAPPLRWEPKYRVNGEGRISKLPDNPGDSVTLPIVDRDLGIPVAATNSEVDRLRQSFEEFKVHREQARFSAELDSIFGPERSIAVRKRMVKFFRDKGINHVMYELPNTITITVPTVMVESMITTQRSLNEITNAIADLERKEREGRPNIEWVADVSEKWKGGCARGIMSLGGNEIKLLVERKDRRAQCVVRSRYDFPKGTLVVYQDISMACEHCEKITHGLHNNEYSRGKALKFSHGYDGTTYGNFPKGKWFSRGREMLLHYL